MLRPVGAVALWLVGLGACAPRAPDRIALGPPFLAWLEPGRDAHELVLMVLPLRRLGTELRVEIRGRELTELRLPAGRHALDVDAGAPVSVSWRDASGSIGARVELEAPRLGSRPVTAARFAPIVRAHLGRQGPSIEQAVRIR